MKVNFGWEVRRQLSRRQVLWLVRLACWVGWRFKREVHVFFARVTA